MIRFYRKSPAGKNYVFLFLLFLIGSQSSPAQQLPQYTQYVFNNYLLNPAISGIENYADLRSSYRTQWQGIEGAPETGTLSLHMPFGHGFGWNNANSFAANGNNPMSRSYLQDYRASDPHHGAGIRAVTDKIGPISTTSADLTYAYHLGLAPRVNLSAGISAGLSYVTIDRSKLKPANAADEAIAANLKSEWGPDLGAGLWLYAPRFFAGLSGMQLLGGNLLGTGSGQTVNIVRKVPHFYVTAGYKAFIAEEIALMPSVLFQKAGPAGMTMDLNAKLAFKDRIWIGGSFRKGDSFSVLTGLNISHFLNVGYSYDFTTSALQQVTGGSHEIVLGFLLNNKYKVVCPQRTW